MNQNTTRSAKKSITAGDPLKEVLLQHGRVPPQAVDLEEVVLGAMMLEKDAVNAIIDILNPEVFY
jgi:replicative DNA helicase